ncbi:MAG TPA: transketolase C-terminal domain-containing protein [Thermotogota bacterium]|jgi:transketolase|nr:transketolase family protein [Thermotogaceae bacterium]OQC30268.1 MAG: 1-deoxy-D-xylulose-5-phosphate synthase [Thermotogota bacterium ADurb.Bin062]HNW47298.1 transketolase C-terminal domain-containing protein [Thermotogota bacterium]HOD91955.1 transketolase C-terminal domain-containing protein [Thermotogota bacterium]HPY47608.1 transketolase C-terminal domain-containing protein [Thermotogota bacterium]
MYEGLEMRKVYAELLIELAQKDDRIVLLEADLMSSTGTKAFKERFPDRLINVGVAEANLMGISAGLAVMGMIPFAHSFTAFATRRAFDQVTISIAYSRLPVKIGGADPGVSAELNGGTHMSFEDAGIMRNLPGMTIVEPVDSVQLAALLPQVISHPGPVYMRLHRKNKEVLFSPDRSFTIGKIETLETGEDVTLICSGMMVKQSLKASEILRKEGVRPRVLNMHTLKPVDATTIIQAARETGAIVVAENHSVLNAWGSAVAEVVSEHCPVPVFRIGVQDHFGEVGKSDFLMEKYHMTAADIVQAAYSAMDKKR